MSINEARQKIKTFISLVEKRDVYGSILIVFVSLGSFSLGRLSTEEISKVPVTIESLGSVYSLENTKISREVAVKSESTTISKVKTEAGKYVASKSGKKYYLLACSGVKRIKEENKIYFNTTEDALAAGFTPAYNCDGI